MNNKTQEFIEKANNFHNNKYDYSKSEYTRCNDKLCIICPIHGEFWQTPHNHLKGQGCPTCGGHHRYTTEEWIDEARKIHGDKYDYSKVKYIRSSLKVCIICPIHGEFSQTPNNHLRNRGRFKCNKNHNRYTTESWIECANLIHNQKYDYSQSVYKGAKTLINIICPQHGIFKQAPTNHLSGHGCPICSSSHLETEIRQLLSENNIEFEEQKMFEWLGLKSLDFYLPKYNIGIECQGIQHFKSVEYFGGINELIPRQIRDECKRKLCEENGIKLIYYANYKYNFPYKVITDKNKLLKWIEKYED